MKNWCGLKEPIRYSLCFFCVCVTPGEAIVLQDRKAGTAHDDRGPSVDTRGALAGHLAGTFASHL